MSGSNLALTMTTEVIPSGGIVKLTYTYNPATDVGPWSLTRSASGSTAAPVTVYSGNPILLTIDAGAGQNIPLDPATTYTYTLTTPNGVLTSTVQPASTVEVLVDDVTILLFRVMQGAFAGMTLPDPSWVRPKIIQAMPLTGTPTLPIISIADDLLQQEDVPIAQNVNPVTVTNDYFVRDIVARRYRVTVMAFSVAERNFYRDAIIGVFKAVMGPLLESIAQNIRHRYQAASSQVVGNAFENANNPGFYFCDLSLEFSGNFFVTVTTNYGQISVISESISAEGVVDP